MVVGVSILVLTLLAVYVWRQLPVALYGTFRDIPEVLVAIAAVVLGLHLLMAFGLWTLRPWGRLLAYGFALAGVAVGMLSLPLGIVGVAVSLTTALYLTEPKVRAVFRASAGRPRAAK